MMDGADLEASVEKLIRDNTRLRHQLERVSMELRYKDQRIAELTSYVSQLEGVVGEQRTMILAFAQQIVGTQKDLNLALRELGQTQGLLYGLRGIVQGRDEGLRALPPPPEDEEPSTGEKWLQGFTFGVYRPKRTGR